MPKVTSAASSCTLLDSPSRCTMGTQPADRGHVCQFCTYYENYIIEVFIHTPYYFFNIRHANKATVTDLTRCHKNGGHPWFTLWEDVIFKWTVHFRFLFWS
jgi:hypothetical protein